MNAIAHRQPGLPMWVIYDRPLDHPQGYIARRWVGETATGETVTGDMLDAVRLEIIKRMPDGVRLGRGHGDHPCIVEVWL